MNLIYKTLIFLGVLVVVSVPMYAAFEIASFTLKDAISKANTLNDQLNEQGKEDPQLLRTRERRAILVILSELNQAKIKDMLDNGLIDKAQKAFKHVEDRINWSKLRIRCKKLQLIIEQNQENISELKKEALVYINEFLQMSITDQMEYVTNKDMNTKFLNDLSSSEFYLNTLQQERHDDEKDEMESTSTLVSAKTVTQGGLLVRCNDLISRARDLRKEYANKDNRVCISLFDNLEKLFEYTKRLSSNKQLDSIHLEEMNTFLMSIEPSYKKLEERKNSNKPIVLQDTWKTEERDREPDLKRMQLKKLQVQCQQLLALGKKIVDKAQDKKNLVRTRMNTLIVANNRLKNEKLYQENVFKISFYTKQFSEIQEWFDKISD